MTDSAAWLAALAAPIANEVQKLSYVKIEGVTNLSYSNLQTFYSCPRKFYLRKQVGGEYAPTPHTAYGHSFGAGVQELFRTGCIKRAHVAALAAWSHPNLWECNKEKNFAEVLVCLDTYYAQLWPILKSKYELATINGKLGIELTFYVRIGDKYNYQGHIDLVLRDKATGEIVVAEIKTSAKAHEPADWYNSSQTLGYNVVLQAIGAMAAEQVSYKVLYLCLHSKTREVTPFTFDKSAVERAEFCNSLMLDIAAMGLYDEHIWPKRGNSCSSWGRSCEYFGLCDSNKMVTPPENQALSYMSLDEVDFVLDFQDLINVQQEQL